MKKFTKFSRGFTLIELLVVIAIIGILSSIVLASLSTARSKANDSKVQEQLSGLRSAAEIFNSSYGGYDTGATVTSCTGANSFFLDTTSGALGIMNGVASTTGVTTETCVASSTAWAVSVNLPSGGSNGLGYWCVDSTGKSEAETNATPPSATHLCN